MFHNFGYGMGWGMFPMMIWWLILFVGITWVVFSLVARQQQDNPPSSAREILEQRYARGDLSRDEYLTMKADLGK